MEIEKEDTMLTKTDPEDDEPNEEDIDDHQRDSDFPEDEDSAGNYNFQEAINLH